MPFKRIASMSRAEELPRDYFEAASAARVSMEKREADESDQLELTYPQGISASQIVDFFAPRGVKLAQATFRKYVQLGLLPRSRRVGEKGKHRGSRGLYPASAIRRIQL